jgi:hypothetical protein
MRRYAGIEQDEFAIPGDEIIQHLLVRAPGTQALSYEQPQVFRKRRVGIVDGLILAHHAAQFARQCTRARFKRGIAQYFARLNGSGATGKKKSSRQQSD